MVSHRCVRLSGLTALMLFLLLGMEQALPQAGSPESDSLKAITISFKFDPGPTYGGVQWVSPPTFTSGLQAGKEATVEVRVSGVDTSGRPVKVRPEWTAADPEMVVVTPTKGDQYRITVKHAGEAKLKVSDRQISTELLVKAKSMVGGKALQLEVSVPGAKTAAPVVSPIVKQIGSAAKASGGTSPDSAKEREDAFPVADNKSNLKSSQEKESYALGMNTGRVLRSRAISIDSELFMQGLKDSIAGSRTLLTEAEVREVLGELQLAQKKRENELRQALRAARKDRGIKILFKAAGSSEAIDAGTSWVSSPIYTAAQDAVEAKAQSLDDAGASIDITPTWTPADPDMVAVSPAEGNAVKISVKRPGETKVTVASSGISKELTVKAKYVAENSFQVEINQ